MMTLPTPRVALVGAGPGDPELITRRGAQRLSDADIVFCDALVDTNFRALAPNASWVDVGKRAGAEPAPQTEITRHLIDSARAGLQVVRLKGGDPFVFGRGGEEALALIAAGVAVEVVPGITTAVAAPGLAGIPVTHRGVASGFVVVTGSNAELADQLFKSIRPGMLTVVVMMSVRSRAELAARAIERGWPASTPAALILGAASAHMWVWRGALDRLGGVVIPQANTNDAGTIVIGDVAALPIDLFQGATGERLRGANRVRA